MGGGNDPPKLRAGDVYSSWKRSIRVWQAGATIDETKQGARVIQALEGRTLDFATRLELAKVITKDGVKFVLDELDKYFKQDETQIAFVAIENLENYTRATESISEYIEEFCRRRDLVEECDGIGAGAYKDSILAYRLLKQARLTQSECQLIRATITKLTLADMIIAMKKTLGDVVVMEGAAASNDSVLPISTLSIKQETSDEGAQFYSNNFRGSGKYNRRYSSNHHNHRGREHDRHSHTCNYTDSRSQDKENAKDQHGNVKTCNICQSTFHFANNCPDRY